MLKRALVIALVSGLLTGAMPAANASLWSGACVVSVTFSFTTPVRATGTSPSYSVSMSSPVDLDPLHAGSQNCAITLDALEPFRRTSASGSGGATTWTCGATVASGSWSQTFRDSAGTLNPPPADGAHLISGTWDEWTLVVNSSSLNMVGVADLTLAATENLKAASCASGGITSLTMAGVMVFQDP